MLIDNHGRVITYLRLAVTDRCNLRCTYCMPQGGLEWLSRKELLSYEELLRLCALLTGMGIQKIRITGGEPFVRNDLLTFLTQLVQFSGLKEVTLTTNGVLTAPLLPHLKEIGIRSINISMDTLDRNRFFSITRRDEFPAVWRTLEAALQLDMEVKINAVVMEGKNTEDIIPLAELTRQHPVSVRFIEEMPFNGTGHAYSGINWNYRRILSVLTEWYPGLQKIADPPSSTALNYAVPGHRGTIGLIPAYTRSFCGTCNRIRLTPEGVIKSCLYDGGVMNIRDLMRSGYSDNALKEALTTTLQQRSKTGWEAEQRSAAALHPSMAAIGG